MVDTTGAFLCGNFQEDKPIYMQDPEGFEKHYPGDVLLLLLSTIYGLKQAARALLVGIYCSHGLHTITC